MFLRGPDAGGDPHEWPTLLDEAPERTRTAPDWTYIAGDGYADGGTPYSAEELERYNRSEEG